MYGLRRLLAIVLQLSLQLAFASPAAACPMTMRAASVPAVAHHAGARSGERAGEGRAPASAHADTPCDACPPLGCAGAGHCASPTCDRVQPAAVAAGGSPAHRHFLDAGAPRSESAAPEPPPPRA